MYTPGALSVVAARWVEDRGVRKHRSHENAPHSTVMRGGDPPEWITAAHSDGSMSEVRISMDHDQLKIDMRPALGKPPRLTGY